MNLVGEIADSQLLIVNKIIYLASSMYMYVSSYNFNI